jgi:simple sugar transport system ATP-binding protein
MGTTVESAPEAIRTENVTKSFGHVHALRGVNLRVGTGEIVGLIGDNGAGKSTLLKILTGFHRPDDGKLFVNGVETEYSSVTDARLLGIETVYQDLALVDDLPVYLNMFLMREPVRRLGGVLPVLRKSEMRRLAAEHLAEMDVRVPSIDTLAGQLSGGQRQAIAIARAVYSRARILLLDEPLAAMGAREARNVLALIGKLKARGDVSLLVIAHNYAHVFEVCDRVSVLQHGRITLDCATSETSISELIDLVAGEYRSRESGNGGMG